MVILSAMLLNIVSRPVSFEPFSDLNTEPSFSSAEFCPRYTSKGSNKAGATSDEAMASAPSI